MRTQIVKAKSYKEAKKLLPWATIIVELYGLGSGNWRGFKTAEDFEQWQET